MDLFRLLLSTISRFSSALTMPFRRSFYSFQRLLNVNVITARIIRPLSKNIRKLLTLRPADRADYVTAGGLWVYKKVFYLLVLVVCAAVFIYFTMFASPVEAAPVSLAEITTDVTYAYDDLAIREFTGVANITAYNGGVAYTGDIAAGVCTGQGVLYSSTGARLYAGAFAGNQYHGDGTKYYPDGTVQYTGGFENNLFSGEGKLYRPDGTPLYEGGFSGGAYSGGGKEFGEDGALLYEGGFADGAFHGSGTKYYENGGTEYTGEFFMGRFQGEGTLFSSLGKELYTGPMQDGEINYTALLGASLQNIGAYFEETPQLYYTDQAKGCFYFEEAGVILTTDCRVKVDVWERENTQDAYNEFYYMPEDLDEAAGEPYDIPENTEGAPGYYMPDAISPSVPDSGVLPPAEPGSVISPDAYVSDLPFEPMSASAFPGIRPISWAVIDDPYSQPSSSPDSSSSSESSSSSGSSSFPEPSPDSPFSPSLEDPSARPDLSSGSSAAEEEADSPWPDFVESNKRIYFEIDADVWVTEEELDRSKVAVQTVTVLGRRDPAPDHTEIEDFAPASLEDCIAIDAVRLETPTAFAGMSFEMDRSNRLFQRVWNIDNTSRLSRRVFLIDGITWRYAYDETEDGPTARYFSLSK